MRKVKQDELLALGAYDAVRDTFRARMIAHKKERRLILGPEMSVVFEDHDTMLLQVQEMLRAERISMPTAVQAEVDTYNELVPPDGALLATLMIELNDEPLREARRREYFGLEQHVWLDLGDDARVQGRFAADGLFADRIAVVQYLTFPMGDGGRERLLDGSRRARLVCTHPRYAHAVALGDATRRSLANDLDPRNAESATIARG